MLKDIEMIDRENYQDYDRVVSLEEISNEIDEEIKYMSEQEKYTRARDADPTFLQSVMSSMINQKKNKAIINEYTYKIQMIE